MRLSIRIVSYNVLSSHLASPTHFTTLRPEHLEARNRLPVVLNKLQEELQQTKDTTGSCVFCLQEVSHDWAGAFHTFFANRGYHMVTGLYGKKYNGYMGVALAWPMDAFETVQVDVSRLSDKRQGGWPRWEDDDDNNQQSSFTNMLFKLWEGLSPVLVETPLRILGLKSEERQRDHWEMSQGRFNILLTATLRDKQTQQTFCVADYHMPCAYYAPMVMTIHAEMAAKHVQSIAGDHPYVLAGDFNIKPTDSVYRLLTTGKGLDKDDPAYPAPKQGYEWTSTIQPMRSAYGCQGGEPDFTNYARVQEEEPFIDTLDYIFVSPEWMITDVKTLPHRDVANGPFPNLDQGEPSDHVLIAATLECPASSV